MLAGRRLMSPVPERVRVEAVRDPEMPIAVPHSLVVDPQVMPRHLRIAPRHSRLRCSRQRGPAPPARPADSERQHIPILTPGAGMPAVANVAGGMNAWERAGLPVRHGAYGPDDPNPFS